LHVMARNIFAALDAGMSWFLAEKSGCPHTGHAGEWVKPGTIAPLGPRVPLRLEGCGGERPALPPGHSVIDALP
jgi:hypothetical protein